MLPVASPSIGQEELDNAVDAIKSGWISSQGPYIEKFEQGFATYCGKKYGVATANGTVALHLALAALDIGPGDEVIVPTFTFIATPNSVIYTGAKPIFVDCERETFGPDPRAIEKAITPRTKAIIPVHLYGHPCQMKQILEIGLKHGIAIVEDAAEAHGAEYSSSNGPQRKAGSQGLISCFSFYGNKTITTGEGGICITDDPNLLEKMRVLRSHGMNPERKYWHDVVGFNYRMTNIQAAIGLAQLAKLDQFVAKKRRLAQMYREQLSDLVSKNKLNFPLEAKWAKASYWMIGLFIPQHRDHVMNELKKINIDSRPFFHPCHTMPPYPTQSSFPVSEEIAQSGVLLPCAVDLTDDQVKMVTDAIKRILEKK